MISIPDVCEAVEGLGRSLESEPHDAQTIAANTIDSSRDTEKCAGEEVWSSIRGALYHGHPSLIKIEVIFDLYILKHHPAVIHRGAKAAVESAALRIVIVNKH